MELKVDADVDGPRGAEADGADFEGGDGGPGVGRGRADPGEEEVVEGQVEVGAESVDVFGGDAEATRGDTAADETGAAVALGVRGARDAGVVGVAREVQLDAAFGPERRGPVSGLGVEGVRGRRETTTEVEAR